MDRHVYVKTGKFKNVNCGYALVGGIVFPSIFAAEEYCTREGLDPNVWVEADDPAVLQKCQDIARATLPMLREIRAELRRGWVGELEAVNRADAALDAAKMDLGRSYYQDRVIKASGEAHGYHSCMVKMEPYIETLDRIQRLGRKAATQ